MQIAELDRRALLRGGAQAGLVTALGGVLGGLMSQQALAAHAGGQLQPVASPYGPISPVADQETGLELLKLPRGFTYRTFSWQGDLMADGNRVKSAHDGMGVVAVGGPGNQDTFLIRNHEVAVPKRSSSRPVSTIPPHKASAARPAALAADATFCASATASSSIIARRWAARSSTAPGA